MNPTPLCDALRAFAAEKTLRMHMPGHKGKELPLPELSAAAALDFTELAPTGDLFAGTGAIGAAEALWAKVFHIVHCFFLTCGSTQGVLSALTLACNPGETVLLDRCSHRSAYHALALLDLKPIYLERTWLAEAGIPGPVVPKDVENLLNLSPNINTLCITSPTYYGVLSDIPALSALMHAHGGKLIVDAAHGAHLPFLGNDDLSAADLVVASAHKTLPALGQTALLFAGDAYTAADLSRAAALYGTSSPSYLLMASLDGARAYLEGDGMDRYRAAAEQVAHLRMRFPALTDRDAPLDPTRFVYLSADGRADQTALEAVGIYPELADAGHVVFILTCADDDADFLRLERALASLPQRASPGLVPLPPPLPEQTLSPHAAFFSQRETISLQEATGRVSACQVAPYPPGVPIVAPGERFDKKTIAYLDQIGYNMMEEIEVVQSFCL